MSKRSPPQKRTPYEEISSVVTYHHPRTGIRTVLTCCDDLITDPNLQIYSLSHGPHIDSRYRHKALHRNKIITCASIFIVSILKHNLTIPSFRAKKQSSHSLVSYHVFLFLRIPPIFARLFSFCSEVWKLGRPALKERSRVVVFFSMPPRLSFVLELLVLSFWETGYVVLVLEEGGLRLEEFKMPLDGLFGRWGSVGRQMELVDGFGSAFPGGIICRI